MFKNFSAKSGITIGLLQCFLNLHSADSKATILDGYFLVGGDYAAGYNAKGVMMRRSVYSGVEKSTMVDSDIIVNIAVRGCCASLVHRKGMQNLFCAEFQSNDVGQGMVEICSIKEFCLGSRNPSCELSLLIKDNHEVILQEQSVSGTAVCVRMKHLSPLDMRENACYAAQRYALVVSDEHLYIRMDLQDKNRQKLYDPRWRSSGLHDMPVSFAYLLQMESLGNDQVPCLGHQVQRVYETRDLQSYALQPLEVSYERVQWFDRF